MSGLFDLNSLPDVDRSYIVVKLFLDASNDLNDTMRLELFRSFDDATLLQLAHYINAARWLGGGEIDKQFLQYGAGVIKVLSIIPEAELLESKWMRMASIDELKELVQKYV